MDSRLMFWWNVATALVIGCIVSVASYGFLVWVV